MGAGRHIHTRTHTHTRTPLYIDTHTHFSMPCFKCELANIWTVPVLSLPPSVFFYLTRPQSPSITSLLFPISLLYPHFAPPPLPQPSCQCQCLMALSKAASPPLISIWEKFNWIGSQSITGSIELWLDLAWDDRVRWVGWGGLVWF